jgi:hypothetical protein
MPVLANVLLAARDGRLRITGTLHRRGSSSPAAGN